MSRLQPDPDCAGTADYTMTSNPQCGIVWCAFAEAVQFPDEELQASIRSSALARRLEILVRDEYPVVCREGNWDALQDAGANEGELSAEYTRLFDSAAGGPCPLNGGLLYGTHMTTMEEVVRFYNHFEVKLGEQTVETPDHLSIELEFVHCLAYGEADRCSRGEDPSAYARARRDFIARHPGRMVSQVHRRLAELRPMPFYAELFRVLDQCLQAELKRLEAQYGATPTDGRVARTLGFA